MIYVSLKGYRQRNRWKAEASVADRDTVVNNWLSKTKPRFCITMFKDRLYGIASDPPWDFAKYQKMLLAKCLILREDCFHRDPHVCTPSSVRRKEGGLYSPFNISLWEWAPQSTMGCGIPSQPKGRANFQKLFLTHTYEALYPWMESTNLKQKRKGTNDLYIQTFPCLEEGQSRAPSVTRTRDTRSRKEASRKRSQCTCQTPF